MGYKRADALYRRLLCMLTGNLGGRDWHLERI